MIETIMNLDIIEWLVNIYMIELFCWEIFMNIFEYMNIGSLYIT